MNNIKSKKPAPNRSVCASPPYGGSGYEKTQSGLRPLCVFSPQHFLCAGIASQFLYRAQKTSNTTETLCVSFFKSWKNVMKTYIDIK